MTASQYKNIVLWTIFENKFFPRENPYKIARILFRNLGISFPQGENTGKLLQILKTNSFLGWRENSWDEAQKYANIGIVSIGMGTTDIIIILPDKEVPVLTSFSDVVSAKTPIVKHTSELSDEEKENLSFFSYRYRFEFDKNS